MHRFGQKRPRPNSERDVHLSGGSAPCICTFCVPLTSSDNSLLALQLMLPPATAESRSCSGGQSAACCVLLPVNAMPQPRFQPRQRPRSMQCEGKHVGQTPCARSIWLSSVLFALLFDVYTKHLFVLPLCAHMCERVHVLDPVADALLTYVLLCARSQARSCTPHAPMHTTRSHAHHTLSCTPHALVNLPLRYTRDFAAQAGAAAQDAQAKR